MYIIGDNQGEDTICGRIVNYGKWQRRTSRMCNAGPELLSKPKLGLCQKLKMHNMMQFVIDEDFMECYRLFQVQHWVA